MSNKTLLDLIVSTDLEHIDSDSIYAQPIDNPTGILPVFGPECRAVLADEQPNGFLYFFGVEQAQMLHERFALEGDQHVEITDEEWTAAAQRVINYVNDLRSGDFKRAMMADIRGGRVD